MDMRSVLVAVAIVVVLIGVALWAWRLQQRRRLRERYGPEYQRLARSAGDAGAERTLSERERRVRNLDIRSLPEPERLRYVDRWRRVQGRFVDDPAGAVGDADTLIGEVMQARGYPVGDFEQRAADVSVDHPQVVENYRAAHQIGSRSRDAGTEDLRKAMLHYRRLFDDLLVSGSDRDERRERADEHEREEARR